MKTEFEISSVISNYITSQEGVTDFAVSLKQISDEVDTLRVRLIEELDAQGKFTRPYFNFNQVVLFDGAVSASKILLNSTTRVRYIDTPRFFIRPSTHKPAISYIGALLGTQNYRIVSGLQREWFKKDKWIGRMPTAVVLESDENEGYRIEFHNVSPNKARLSGVFEDPSDLEPFGYNGEKTTAQGGSLYPLPSGMVDVIIGKTVNSYLNTMYRRPLQANQAADAPGQGKGPEA